MADQMNCFDRRRKPVEKGRDPFYRSCRARFHFEIGRVVEEVQRGVEKPERTFSAATTSSRAELAARRESRRRRILLGPLVPGRALDLQLERLHQLVGFALKKDVEASSRSAAEGSSKDRIFSTNSACGRLVVEFSHEVDRLIQQLLSITREKSFHLFKLTDDLLALSSSLERGRPASVTTAENGQTLAEFLRWPEHSHDGKRLNFGELESRLSYPFKAKKRAIEVTRVVGIVIPTMRENEDLLCRAWQRNVAEDSTVLIEAKFVEVDIGPGNCVGMGTAFATMSNRLNRTHEINETRSLEITVSLEVGRGGENLFDALRLADELAPNGKEGDGTAHMWRGRARPTRLDIVALFAASGVQL